jgi:hypothetical protein
LGRVSLRRRGRKRKRSRVKRKTRKKKGEREGRGEKCRKKSLNAEVTENLVVERSWSELGFEEMRPVGFITGGTEIGTLGAQRGQKVRKISTLTRREWGHRQK